MEFFKVRRRTFLNFQDQSRSMFFFLNADGTEWTFSPVPDDSAIPEMGVAFQVEPLQFSDITPDAISLGAWPAFMAFSLLHCKNIAAEDNKPSKPRQKDRKRAGLPRLVTYKTLKIEVPRSVQARKSYEGADDGEPKVRFHLCSGHFRELRSEKFVNKQGQLVWVPSHFRGSKDLGEVHKTYKLTPP